MRINNRLIVIGSKQQVQSFTSSKWEGRLSARDAETMQSSPGRFVVDFKTTVVPLEPLRGLSWRWPKLAFLLVHENEQIRSKGLAKVKAGQLAHCEIEY